MENASRALLMAGGVLMAILVISMLVLMFSNLTNVFSESNQANREAQIVKFNMEYESYNREGVRGTELLSLLAKVEDYNKYQSDYEGTQAGYSPITVEIKFTDKKKNLKYNDDDEFVEVFKTNQLTQNNIGQNSQTYNNILEIKNTAKNSLKAIGGSRKKSKDATAELSDSDLETLTASLELLKTVKENLNRTTPSYDKIDLNQMQKTLALMQRIFNPEKSGEKLKDDHNNNLIVTRSTDEGISKLRTFLNNNYSDIEKYTKQYYQFQQFKKSYFDCEGERGEEGVKYDQNTGRVKELKFKYTGTGD